MRGVACASFHIATAITAAVPCYNLGGLHEPLNFSPDVLAGVFLGKIRKMERACDSCAEPVRSASSVGYCHDWPRDGRREHICAVGLSNT